MNHGIKLKIHRNNNLILKIIYKNFFKSKIKKYSFKN